MKDDELQELVDGTLAEFEHDEQNALAIQEDGKTTIVTVRRAGWRRWIFVGLAALPFLLIAAYLLVSSVIQVGLMLVAGHFTGLQPFILGLLSLGGLVGVVFAVASNQVITIGGDEIAISTGVGPLRKKIHIPYDSIQGVRVLTFKFVNDPLVEIQAGKRTVQLARSVPLESAEWLAALVRSRIAAQA